MVFPGLNTISLLYFRPVGKDPRAGLTRAAETAAQLPPVRVIGRRLRSATPAAPAACERQVTLERRERGRDSIELACVGSKGEVSGHDEDRASQVLRRSGGAPPLL